MASAGWQSWLLDVRAVYRWEKPRTTGKWFALYVVLWYTEHLTGFLVRVAISGWGLYTYLCVVWLYYLYRRKEPVCSNEGGVYAGLQKTHD